jgi:hypothetical protein
MLSGSFASAYYGSVRSTQDIDFVIAPTAEQLRIFVQSLPSSEYYVDLDAALESLERRSLFNIIDFATGWKIDLILRKPRAFSQEEFDRRQRVKLENLDIFVASAEDVILSKLEWSKLAQSRRHIEDAGGILRMRWEGLDRSYLGKWVSELGLEQQWEDAQSAAGI